MVGAGGPVAFVVVQRDLDHLPHFQPAGERSVGALDPQVLGMADEPQSPVAAQRSVQQVGLGEGLEAVADAQHQPAVGRERRHFLHDGAEAGDGAGAQVVPVGEAARQDDALSALEIPVLVPQIVGLGLGERGQGVNGIVVAVGAGEDDDAETDATLGHLRLPPPRSMLEAVVLDDRVGQQFAAHVVNVGLGLLGVGARDLQSDVAAHPDVRHPGMAERRQSPLDDRALRVDDSSLGGDIDRDLVHSGSPPYRDEVSAPDGATGGEPTKLDSSRCAHGSGLL